MHMKRVCIVELTFALSDLSTGPKKEAVVDIDFDVFWRCFPLTFMPGPSHSTSIVWWEAVSYC